MSDNQASASAPRRPSAAVRWLAAAGLALAIAAGVWVIGAVVGEYIRSVALTGVWFAVTGVAALLAARRRPGLGRALGATFLVVVAASAAGFYWTSVRDRVVDEAVVTGVAASRLPVAEAAAASPPRVNVTESRGVFASLAHASQGTAAVVRLPDGRRILTLTGFRTSNGPDLRVRLVAGVVNDNGDGDGAIDLGALKGNIGDQQYDIPGDADLARNATVVIWCRAFTVGFARAPLVAA